jgi:hypothetical protein
MADHIIKFINPKGIPTLLNINRIESISPARGPGSLPHMIHFLLSSGKSYSLNFTLSEERDLVFDVLDEKIRKIQAFEDNTFDVPAILKKIKELERNKKIDNILS